MSGTNMETFVVTTQILENYGSHTTDGEFSSGNAYWKFKGGSTYIVKGLSREQDAMAYVAGPNIENTVNWKEFPVEVMTMDEFESRFPEASDLLDFELREAITLDASVEIPTKPKSRFDLRGSLGL